jgi:hypothetical protein
MKSSDTDAEAAEPAATAGAGAPIDPSIRSSFEELAPALPGEAAVLRRKPASRLEQLPLDPGSGYDIALATYEALANVVAHAYPTGPAGHGCTPTGPVTRSRSP